MQRIALSAFAIGVIGFVAIQLVPYGRAHTNPPVTGEPTWDSADTRALAVRACFDCHSNETVWPWYANVAPISWLLQRHVDEGREKLNVSQWGSGEQETEHLVRLVREGGMPPWDFVLMHPEAALSDTEQQALIDGLRTTLGAAEDRASDEDDDG